MAHSSPWICQQDVHLHRIHGLQGQIWALNILLSYPYRQKDRSITKQALCHLGVTRFPLCHSLHGPIRWSIKISWSCPDSQYYLRHPWTKPIAHPIAKRRAMLRDACKTCWEGEGQASQGYSSTFQVTFPVTPPGRAREGVLPGRTKQAVGLFQKFSCTRGYYFVLYGPQEIACLDPGSSNWEFYSSGENYCRALRLLTEASSSSLSLAIHELECRGTRVSYLGRRAIHVYNP